ncbi:low temperature requirement protein A [Nocardia tengchongensis]|uniref:low temperature requirement protein A n=1 Tax=Nocardia tengchongensis TaxID=2055889 RepID=UPI00369423E3
MSRRFGTPHAVRGSHPTAVPRAVASVEGDRVTAVELFFDLAYVFGFTQVSRLMADAHTAMGVLQGLTVLALLWWSWTAYSWLANQLHADEGFVRGAMFTGMTAVFVVAVMVPEAYADRTGGLSGPLIFVAAYLVARLTHLTVYMFTSVGGPAARREVVQTVCLSIVPSAALLIGGALLGSPWQVWCVLTAVTVEPVIANLTTWDVRSRISSATHFVERHRLVVILALGESTVAIGVGAGPIDIPPLAGVLLAMAIAIALWRAYFGELATAAEHALCELDDRERSRAAHHGYTYLHLPIVAGIVLSALGIETAMAHISGTGAYGLFGAVALAGGAALYLIGTALFARRVVGAAMRPRLLAALIMLTATPALSPMPPLAALATTAALLFGVLSLDRLSPISAPEAGRRSATHVA